MLELIRKSLLAGLGVGVITKEKAQQVAQELVEEGKLAADDAKQFVDRLLEGANEQREEIQAGIRDAVRKALDSTDVARAEDLQIIKQQLAGLELRLAALENRERQDRPLEAS
jgi:polyhydroxyalkanoate synthesis regulator phasin